MMMIKHFTLAAAATCLMTIGSASAEDLANPHTGKPQKLTVAASTFTQLDRNGDQRISRSEAGFDRVMSGTFAEIDTDGDGFVSSAEYASAEKTRNTVSSNTPSQ
jgi:hypothetical protein